MAGSGVAARDGARMTSKDLQSWPRMTVATLREHFKGPSSLFAGAVAFFTSLALAPLLVLAVAMVGTVFGEEAARARLVEDVTAAMGPEIAAVLDSFVRRAALDEARWWRVILGAVIAAWGATNIFVRLQETLNAMWGVRPREGRTFRERVGVLLRKRLSAFVLVLVVGALLLASMLLQSYGAGLAALATELPLGTLPWRIAQGVFAVALVTAFLVPVYRVLPDVELAWKDVLPGAVVAAVIASLGAYGMGMYLGYTATSSLSGAAGGLLLLLLWMYFDAHVLLFGARLGRAYVARRKGRIVPQEHAELVEPKV
jgi:membrane protein